MAVSIIGESIQPYYFGVNIFRVHLFWKLPKRFQGYVPSLYSCFYKLGVHFVGDLVNSPTIWA